MRTVRAYNPSTSSIETFPANYIAAAKSYLAADFEGFFRMVQRERNTAQYKWRKGREVRAAIGMYTDADSVRLGCDLDPKAVY